MKSFFKDVMYLTLARSEIKILGYNNMKSMSSLFIINLVAKSKQTVSLPSFITFCILLMLLVFMLE